MDFGALLWVWGYFGFRVPRFDCRVLSLGVEGFQEFRVFGHPHHGNDQEEL